MILANIIATAATVVAVYVFITYAERKFNVVNEIVRDLSGK